MQCDSDLMVFMSNRLKTDGEDYFLMLSIAIDIFTHTWSLSLEVQFYLLLPILYLLISKLTPSKITIFSTLALISYCYSTVILTETEAFNSLFARCWQFFMGTIVNLIGKVDLVNSKIETPIKYSCLTLILWILAYPIKSNSIISRPIFTISTSLLILLSSGDQILSLPALTYFGDISYSLYLIHWPIYAYWKLVWSGGENENLELFIAIISALILAVMSYEKFEKWYLKLTNKSLTILCLSLLVLNFGLLEFDRVRDYLTAPEVGSRLDGLNENRKISYEEAMNFHREWTIHDYRNLYAPTCEYDKEGGPLGYCKHTGLDTKTGKWKMMVIGNSWAANHARIFYDECRWKSKSIVQVSEPGCDPLVAHRYNAEVCIPTLKKFVKYVEEEKPDFLFIISRMMDVRDPLPPNVTNFEDDPILHSMKIQTNRLMKNVKNRIFLLTPFPDFDSKNVHKIVDKVRNGADLVELDKSLVLHDGALARKRYQKLESECPKCELIDYKPIFYRNSTKTWRFYDVENSGLSYVTSENHFSFHGLELIRSIYTDISKKL